MNTNEIAEQATDRAREAAETIRNSAETLSSRAAMKAREASAMADFYVREYAWTSVAMVAITAGLIGYLLGRREN
ncbi:MAG TPA: hypothetical protein VEH04_05365 [Verrucomicrobiae bacterium]|nr:hypothetical protein [Verrucomicrobiae bacterium]